MKKCPFCNTEIEENARFCLYCMTALNDKQVIVNTPKKIARRLFIIAAVFVFVLSSIWGIYAVSKLPTVTVDGVPSESEKSTVEDNLSTDSANDETSPSESTSTSLVSSSSAPENSSSDQSSSSSQNTSTSSTQESPSENSSQNSSSTPSSQTSSVVSDGTSSVSSSNTSSYEASPLSLFVYKEYSSYPYGIIITNCYTTAQGKITVPKTIDGKKVTVIGSGTFNNCNKITSITIPSGVQQIQERAFSNCTSLTSVTLPSTVTSIASNAFYNCSSLKTITIPSKVRAIYSSTFSGCTSLTSVRIPASVNGIGANAFSGCNKLSVVYYGGSPEKREALVIESGNPKLLTASWIYNNY